MPTPIVTTVVLCYNQAQFVLETLESVKAQTYKNTQFIIVDDYSSDDSVPVIEGWLRKNGIDDCTFIRHSKNEGICKSLNDAVRAADGKYISMTASDDTWLPDKIERQVEIMESQPESVGVLYSDAFQMDANGNLLPEMFIPLHRNLPEMPQGEILSVLLEGNFIPAMTTLIRRSCYGIVGLYDETLPWEDWDMWMRIARRFSFLFSATPSAKYRIHGQSYTRLFRKSMTKDLWNMWLKQFELGLEPEEELKVVGIISGWASYFYGTFDDITEAMRWVAASVRQASLPDCLRETLRDSSSRLWVPALMSPRVSLAKKQVIIQLVGEIDPHPWRRAIRPALTTIGLKLQRYRRSNVVSDKTPGASGAG